VTRDALRALRRVHEARTDRAHAAVAAGLQESSVAEAARRREEERFAALELQISTEDLPAAALELRALAALAAHRTRLHGLKAAARDAVAAASTRAEAARGVLGRAQAAQRDAMRGREAIEAHHAAWLRSRLRAREAAEEAAAEENVAARWGRPRG
jgi:hypothetical protein